MSSFLTEANRNEQNDQSDDEIQRRSPFVTIEKKRVQTWVFNKRHFNLRRIVTLNYCEKSDCEDFTDEDASNEITENHKMNSRKENCNSQNGNSISRKPTVKAQNLTEFKQPSVYKNKKTDVGKLPQKKKISLRSYRMLRKNTGNNVNKLPNEKTEESPSDPSEVALTQEKVMITIPLNKVKDCVSKNEMSGSKNSIQDPDIREVQKRMSILFGEEFEATADDEKNSIAPPASPPSQHSTDVFSTQTAEKSSRNTDESSLQNADVMEHFKKRLIHQLESNNFETTNNITSDTNPSNKNETVPQDSQSSKPEVVHTIEKSEPQLEDGATLRLPESPPKEAEDKKKDVIQRLARRKSVSRSQFRHENIPVFKLGTSIHERNKSVPANINSEKRSEKSVPKESLTADIIQAIDGNKSPKNRHQLPLLSISDLRRNSERMENKTSHEMDGNESNTHGSDSIKKDGRTSQDFSEKRYLDRKYSRLRSLRKTDCSEEMFDKTETRSSNKLKREESHPGKTETSQNSRNTREKQQKEQQLEEQQLKEQPLKEQLLKEQEKITSQSREQENEEAPIDKVKEQQSEPRKIKEVNNEQQDNLQENKNPPQEEHKVQNQHKNVDDGTDNSGKQSKLSKSVSIGASRDPNAPNIRLGSTLLNIPITSSDGDTNRTSIQIRIGDSLNNNDETNKNLELSEFLDNYIKLARSTMASKFCKGVLGILQFYNKIFTQHLKSIIPNDYRLRLQEIVGEIIVYVKRGLFGKNPKSLLMVYAQRILESNYKDHEDFFDVHLGILKEKCNDPEWMEQFIKTISQSKQSILNQNSQIHQTNISREDKNAEQIPSDSDKNEHILANTTVLDYNRQSSAKSVENLRRLQIDENHHGDAFITSVQNIPIPGINTGVQSQLHQSLVMPNVSSNLPTDTFMRKTNHSGQQLQVPVTVADLVSNTRSYSQNSNSHQIYPPPRPVTAAEFFHQNRNLVPQSGYFSDRNENAAIPRPHSENLHTNNMGMFHPNYFMQPVNSNVMYNSYPIESVKEVSKALPLLPHTRYNPLDQTNAERFLQHKINQQQQSQVAPPLPNIAPVSSPTVTSSYPTERQMHEAMVLQSKEAQRMISNRTTNRKSAFMVEPPSYEVANKYSMDYTNTKSIPGAESEINPRIYSQRNRDAPNDLLVRNNYGMQSPNANYGVRNPPLIADASIAPAVHLTDIRKSVIPTYIESQNDSTFFPPTPAIYPNSNIQIPQNALNDARMRDLSTYLLPPQSDTRVQNLETPTASRSVQPQKQRNRRNSLKRSRDNIDEIHDLSSRKKTCNNPEKYPTAEGIMFTQKAPSLDVRSSQDLILQTSPLVSSINTSTSRGNMGVTTNSSIHRRGSEFQSSIVVPPKFDFLQEIRSPSPDKNPKHNLNIGEIQISKNISRRSNEIQNVQSVDNSEGISASDHIRNSQMMFHKKNTIETMTDKTDVVENLVLQDNSMEITKTTKDFKIENKDDVFEDKKNILERFGHLHDSKYEAMVTILRNTSQAMYDAIKTIYRTQHCEKPVLSSQEVITIDDDDDDDVEAKSPESTTIEKVTEEPSEEVPPKKLRPSDENLSNSAITTSGKVVKLISSPRVEVEIERVDPILVQLPEMVKDAGESLQKTAEENTQAKPNQNINHRLMADSSLPNNGINSISIVLRHSGSISPPRVEPYYSPSSRSRRHSSVEHTAENASVMLHEPSGGQNAEKINGVQASGSECSASIDRTTEDGIPIEALSEPPASSSDHPLLGPKTPSERQEIVSRPIRNDLTSVRCATKSGSAKVWNYTLSKDLRRNKQKVSKSRRNSVESRSSFSDASSPSPSEDIATVTIGSSSFHIKKTFLDYIPKGKLYYKKDTNTFVQCYANGETRNLQIVNEPKLPKKWIFTSEADFNDAARFAEEFEKVQKYVPQDFSYYYKFVTGYQICHNKKPISFRTFLEMHNGDRMDTFFVKYLDHLQKFSLSGVNNPEEWKVS